MPRDKQYTPEEIEQKFEEYRQMCMDNVKHVPTNSGKVLQIPTPRVMSLGEFQNILNIHHSTWSNYREREGYELYFATIKRIDGIIENQKASALINGDGNTTGLIFDLKANHGWRDKQEIDLNHKGNNMTVNIVRPKQEE